MLIKLTRGNKNEVRRRIAMHVYQTKIFADNFKEKISADGAFNKWILNHKNIQIIEYRFWMFYLHSI